MRTNAAIRSHACTFNSSARLSPSWYDTFERRRKGRRERGEGGREGEREGGGREGGREEKSS